MSDDRQPIGSAHAVADVSEIPAGTHKIVRVANLEIGVYNIQGEFFALHNMCPHQYGPACAGPVGNAAIAGKDTDWRMHLVRDGEILTCPWHGMEFDLKSGQCLSQKEMRLRTFPVQIVDHKVCIELRSRRSSVVAQERSVV